MGQLVSIDEYLDRSFGPGYNCLDFCREVWLAMTGEDIGELLRVTVEAQTKRRMIVTAMRNFKRLTGPQNPCLVVMQRLRLTPHVGIYFNGKILHLSASGVQYQPLTVASLFFQTIRYYR